MRKKATLFFLLLFILFNVSCKDDSVNKDTSNNTKGGDQSVTEGIQDFEQFFKVFTRAVKTKDKVLLETLLADKIQYDVGDKRDNYTREQIIDTFDFKYVEEILVTGYKLNVKIPDAYCPPTDKDFIPSDYNMRFRNKNKKGWKLHLMYKLY